RNPYRRTLLLLAVDRPYHLHPPCPVREPSPGGGDGGDGGRGDGWQPMVTRLPRLSPPRRGTHPRFPACTRTPEPRGASDLWLRNGSHCAVAGGTGAHAQTWRSGGGARGSPGTADGERAGSARSAGRARRHMGVSGQPPRPDRLCGFPSRGLSDWERDGGEREQIGGGSTLEGERDALGGGACRW